MAEIPVATLPDGTAALPSLSFTTAVSLGLYRAAGPASLGVSALGLTALTVTGVAAAVNYLDFAPAIAGQAPTITAKGTDTDIGITLTPKGAGTANITINPSITGTITGTSASATALTIGRLGATTPALQVDASTATSITGIKIKSAGTGGGVAISAIGEASNGALTIDAQGSGTLTLQGTATGRVLSGTAVTITSASATAIAIGRLGATTPAFVVDASAATSITGIKITSQASAGGVGIAAVGEASNGALTLDAQGSGTITLGGTSTGNIVLGRAATGVSLSVTGALTAKSGTAVPASAGAIAAGAAIVMYSGANSIWITSDTPAFSATKGDLAINTGGSSSSTRLFINNGTTNWVAVTTAS